MNLCVYMFDVDYGYLANKQIVVILYEHTRFVIEQLFSIENELCTISAVGLMFGFVIRYRNLLLILHRMCSV